MTVLLSVLKRFWREILILVLVLIVALSVRSCRTQQSMVTTSEHLRDSLYTKVTRITLDKGKLAYQVVTAEQTIAQIKQFGNELGLDNKRLKDENINLSSLVAYWKGKAQIHDTIYSDLTDTVYLDHGIQETGKEFGYQGKYLQLSGFIPQGDASIHLDYTYNVDFNLIAFRKGKSWFKRGQLVADIQFSDQNLKVQSFQGVVVKESEKKVYERNWFWGLMGLVAGFGLGSK